MTAVDSDQLETATFGAGCFWCVEAVLARINGVVSATSGYMGGHVDHPTYRQVCTGETGHAEVVQLRFAPSVVSFESLCEVFFELHDPTTLNRQGADVGTQYRSVIFTHDAAQRETAQAVVDRLTKSARFSDPIVTEISEATTFCPAEDYHQNYFADNGHAPYCQFVIAPKLRKLGLA